MILFSSPTFSCLVGSIFILAWLAAVGSSTSEAQSDQAAKRITVVSNARLRVSPETTAEEVGRLPLGTIVTAMDRSATKEAIGDKEDFWYRVKTDDDMSGQSGWMFGGLTTAFSPNRREEIYQRIAAERLITARKDFFEQVDFYKFLERALAEVKTPAVVAELEMARLLALSESLRAIPHRHPRLGPRQPYADWVQIHEAQIVYSDPAGTWFVKSDRFWELEKKYRALPIGERIAWIASQYELPGECEGYVSCYFSRLALREEKYLKLYPNGAHAEDVVDRIDELLRYTNPDTQFFQNQLRDELSSEERSQLKKDIAELRYVLAKVTTPKKNAVLQRLAQLSQAIP